MSESGTGGGERPAVGSVAEEAAKLFGALSDWADQTSGDLGAGTAGRAEGLAGFLHDVDAHLATGGEDCRYCPVCRVISAVRATSPEVRDHLGTAASSLLQAAAGLLATPVADRRADDVQHIDLDADTTGDWEDDSWD